jgi:bifunctional non-homologous end joining protein LigD
VIQQHDATRLHWDLRLEREGVLASWAIPNGLPRDPDSDRKAVRTEDHPLEYLSFEGEIPKGEYGAGTMEIWDSGTYEPEAWEERKVVIDLQGERVRGRYALFHAGAEEKDWMIHRIDPPADPDWEPIPDALVPMQASRGELPRAQRGFGYEIDWGGVRVLAYSEPGRLSLRDSNLDDVTARYPEVRRLNRQLGSHSAVLDGEICAFTPDGHPSAERLAQRIDASEEESRRRAKRVPVSYVIFDLLYLDGRLLLELPYRERRERLAELDLGGAAWQAPDYFRGDGRELLEASARLGVTGIVAKRLDSAYEPGSRSRAWIEVGRMGAAGQGEPERDERPEALVPARSRRARKLELEVAGRSLTVSNLGKLMYPDAGFSKADVIDYYARIAAVLLPHVRERPLTLKRYPDGVGGAYFFEKACPEHRPAWVATTPIWSERHQGEIDYCVVTEEATLIWLANLADLEIHPSLSRRDDPERPTSMVFDLDPGAPAGLLDACQVALWLRGLFDQLGLRAFAKVSGGKGIHLHVPLNGEHTYDEVKPFARQIAETLEQRFGDRVIANMAKAKRAGRVLIDWGQNDRHKTTASVYSLRARDRPTVSVPLEWEELERACAEESEQSLRFEAAQALARVADRGDLFAPVLSLRQRLPL